MSFVVKNKNKKRKRKETVTHKLQKKKLKSHRTKNVLKTRIKVISFGFRYRFIGHFKQNIVYFEVTTFDPIANP